MLMTWFHEFLIRYAFINIRTLLFSVKPTMVLSLIIVKSFRNMSLSHGQIILPPMAIDKEWMAKYFLI